MGIGLGVGVGGGVSESNSKNHPLVIRLTGFLLSVLHQLPNNLSLAYLIYKFIDSLINLLMGNMNSSLCRGQIRIFNNCTMEELTVSLRCVLINKIHLS